MFTKNIKDTFTANLLNAVSGVLGEAKKCKECGCAECTCDTEDDSDETNEGYIPTTRNLTARDNETIGKLAALMKKEREAKEKKEPLGVKTEETIEEKRGLWDNIHAKRERIKRGSGERMRKPGSEGAPTAQDFKDSQKESVDPDLESELKATRQTPQSIAKWNVVRNGKTVSSHSSKDAADVKAMKHPSNKVVAKEEAEIEEAVGDISVKKLSPDEAFKKHTGQMTKKTSVPKDPKTGKTLYQKVTSEEVEQIDELKTSTLDSYRSKARTQIINARNKDDEKTEKRLKGYTKASQKITRNFVKGMDEAAFDADSKAHDAHYEKQTEKVKNALDNYARRGMSYKQAYNKIRHSSTHTLRHEITAMHEEVEQIDELSKGTLGSYIKKASHQAAGKASAGGMAIAGSYPNGEAEGIKLVNKAFKRSRGVSKAVDKLTKEEQDFIDSLNSDTLDEARGRPRKAGAKDFTIHPKTKEKLMHNNPEHMRKIELLQKNGILPKPKTEAGQNIMTQLQKAKTSMRGGETIHFTHGDSHHVSGTHAAKLLDKHAGMKPAEKETFQKKIGHSHANLQSEL